MQPNPANSSGDLTGAASASPPAPPAPPAPIIFSPPPPPPPGMEAPIVANRVADKIASFNALSTPLSQEAFIREITQEKTTLDGLLEEAVQCTLDIESDTQSQATLNTTNEKIRKSRKKLLDLGRHYSKSNLNLSEINSALELDDPDVEGLEKLLNSKRALLDLVVKEVDGLFSFEKLGDKTEDSLKAELEKLKAKSKSVLEKMQSLFTKTEHLKTELERLVATEASQDPKVEDKKAVVQKQLDKIQKEIAHHQKTIANSKDEITKQMKLLALCETRRSLIYNGLEAELRVTEAKLNMTIGGDKSKGALKKSGRTSREQEFVATTLSVVALTSAILEEKKDEAKAALFKDKAFVKRIHDHLYSRLNPADFLLMKQQFPAAFEAETFEDELICQQLSERLLRYSVFEGTKDPVLQMTSRSPFPNQAEFRETLEFLLGVDLITGEPLSPEALAQLYPDQETGGKSALDEEIDEDLFGDPSPQALSNFRI